MYLVKIGRFNEALAEVKKAQELDPLSLTINTQVGRVFYFSRRYYQAIEQFRQTPAMDPSFGQAHLNLGRAYLAKRMYQEAIAEFRAGLQFAGDDPNFIESLGIA